MKTTRIQATVKRGQSYEWVRPEGTGEMQRGWPPLCNTMVALYCLKGGWGQGAVFVSEWVQMGRFGARGLHGKLGLLLGREVWRDSVVEGTPWAQMTGLLEF